MWHAVVRHHVVVNQVALQRAHKSVTPCLQTDVVIDARVVHQAVNAAKFGHNLLNRSAASGILGQLDLNEHVLGIGGSHLPSELGGHRAFAQNDRDGTLLCQRQRDRGTNATGATGHDDHFVFQM
ncbi:MAG: hypothetical protein ACD_23C00549G0001 [uncultured bacterium]|nr:MAG: hypothetical protein ACD_23C00549G0001 [uncultured bacterium]